MKFKILFRPFFIAFCLLLFGSSLHAQLRCSDGNFYDSGGINGDYGINENLEVSICPDNPGDYVELEFTLVDVELSYDILRVYDGTGTGSQFPNSLGGNGVTVPDVFASTDPDGCVTVTFTSDGSLVEAGWEATVTCLNSNNPPTVVDDAATTPAETPIEINVVGNDFDGDGVVNAATVSIVVGPANGTTAVNPGTGVVTYTPNVAFIGVDTFDYEVCDNDGACATATVTVTVEEVCLPSAGSVAY